MEYGSPILATSNLRAALLDPKALALSVGLRRGLLTPRCFIRDVIAL
jgi:hypothetical protein